MMAARTLMESTGIAPLIINRQQPRFPATRLYAALMRPNVRMRLIIRTSPLSAMWSSIPDGSGRLQSLPCTRPRCLSHATQGPRCNGRIIFVRWCRCRRTSRRNEHHRRCAPERGCRAALAHHRHAADAKQTQNSSLTINARTPSLSSATASVNATSPSAASDSNAAHFQFEH